MSHSTRSEKDTELVVLDADGTIAWQTLGSYWFPAVHNVAERYGLEVPETKMASHLAHDPYAAPDYGLPADLAETFGDAVRAEAQRLAEKYPFQPSRTLVQLIKQLQSAEILMSVATSANKPWAIAVLKNLGMYKGVFAKIMTRDDVPRGETKPHPRQLLEIMEYVGIDPAHTAMVGDSPSDVKAGFAAGVGKNILFRPNGHDLYHASSPALDAQLLSMATHRAATFGDVGRIVLNGSLR